jgi:hypothetical protein
MSRRESVGRVSAKTQSSSAPPTQETVSVAVLPPRLKANMAPPTGLGPADAFNWDESLNWTHNQPIEEPEPSRRKSFFRKAGLTTKRQKANPDVPPFVLRQVSYDVWRKHYAKDKDGNYKGTHAPAEDCLLKPDDVAKWRLGDPVTKGDLWTRGREALPVYAEIKDTAAVPEYEHDYDGPPRRDPAAEPYHDVTQGVPDSVTLDAEDEKLASHMERTKSVASQQSQPSQTQRLASIAEPAEANTARTGSESGQIIANGKTAQQIIDEARERNAAKGKQSWKETLKRGTEYALLGNNV